MEQNYMLLSLKIAANAHLKRIQLQTASIVDKYKLKIDPKQHYKFIDQFRIGD